MSFADGLGDFWIGLTDELVEGTYVWGSGQSLSADVATHWDNGQPDNYDNSDCIKILNNGALYDTQCTPSIKERFVCQKRLRGVCMILQFSIRMSFGIY